MPSSHRSLSDIYPSLTYTDAPAAIDWLCRAFGFTKRFVVAGEGGRVEHSELSLGTGVVMIGSAKPEEHRVNPKARPKELGGNAQTLSVFVGDPDAHCQVALAAGARLVRELRTEDYGARGYMVFDPEGHLWYFGNYRPGAYWEAEATEQSAQAPITAANPTVEQMEARVARFADLRPTDDYVDAELPGCERTTLRVLGTPPAAPLAAEAFHLNIVRCAPGKAAPLHNHLTQEVFMPLSGVWEVFWGPEGERSLRLGPWDTVSIPPGLSRGFRNAGVDDAYLVGMAGGHDPGRINWPESVRAAARAAGVALPIDP